jgi:hypothetical protein
MAPDGWSVDCSATGCSYSISGQAEAKVTFTLTDAEQDELYKLFRENTTPGKHAPSRSEPVPADYASFSLQVRYGTEVYNDVTGGQFTKALMKYVDSATTAKRVALSFGFDKAFAGRTVSATVCGHSIADGLTLATADGGAVVLSTTALPGACRASLYFDDKTMVNERVTFTAPKVFSVHAASGKVTLD